MAESKTYLNVPYAQKDEAKSLGARWDAANKKWYVPASKDIALFAKWQTDSIAVKLPKSAASKQNSKPPANKTGTSNNNPSFSVFTYPSIEDFVAYDGDEPPWD